MASISNRDDSASSGNDRRVGDVALHALIPFSGAFSPENVRTRMAGPSFNGRPGAIWRKTTIQHSNAEGSYCLYACERTGEAMWVPNGEYFVADQLQGAQPLGTVMDYLLSQRLQTVRPGGYGFHHAGRTVSGENGNIRRPRNNHVSLVERPGRTEATRLHRFNPLARQEPAVAGTGSKKTVARRERREKAREANQHPTPPPTPTVTTTTTAPSKPPSTPRQSTAPPIPSPAPRSSPSTTSNSTMVFYNSNHTPDGEQQPTNQGGDYRLAVLNLSDSSDSEPDERPVQ